MYTHRHIVYTCVTTKHKTFILHTLTKHAHHVTHHTPLTRSAHYTCHMHSCTTRTPHIAHHTHTLHAPRSRTLPALYAPTTHPSYSNTLHQISGAPLRSVGAMLGGPRGGALGAGVLGEEESILQTQLDPYTDPQESQGSFIFLGVFFLITFV